MLYNLEYTISEDDEIAMIQNIGNDQPQESIKDVFEQYEIDQNKSDSESDLYHHFHHSQEHTLQGMRF